MSNVCPPCQDSGCTPPSRCLINSVLILSAAALIISALALAILMTQFPQLIATSGTPIIASLATIMALSFITAIISGFLLYYSKQPDEPSSITQWAQGHIPYSPTPSQPSYEEQLGSALSGMPRCGPGAGYPSLSHLNLNPNIPNPPPIRPTGWRWKD